MLEMLESRVLFSAGFSFADGVSVKASGANLDVRSGAGSDNLAIYEDHGTVQIQDLATGETHIELGIKHISVDLKNGNDNLYFQGNTVGDIDGGPGDDVLTVLDTGSGSSTVNGGSGSDTVILLYSPNASLKSGSGKDFVAVNAAATNASPHYNYDASQTIVKTGSGSDVVVVYAGSAIVSTGSGNDAVFNVNGTITGN